MDNTLYIKYQNGSMTINMDGAFPCSKEYLKKLLKVINMDYDNSDKHIEKMKSYFRERILICQQSFEENKNEYQKYIQLAEERSSATFYKKMATEKMKAAKDYDRQMKKFKKLIEML